MVPALILFALTYLLMLALPQHRPFAALGGALLFVLLGAAGCLRSGPLCRGHQRLCRQCGHRADGGPGGAGAGPETGRLPGATLGGNLTPIGASANIAALGILRRQGETVRTADFLRIGVPFTLAAVCAGYLYLWLVWGPAA